MSCGSRNGEWTGGNLPGAGSGARAWIATVGRGSRGHAATKALHGRSRCRSMRTHVGVACRWAPHFGMLVEPLTLLFGSVVPAVVVTCNHGHNLAFPPAASEVSGGTANPCTRRAIL